jgi:hypothetical protein
MTNLQSTYVYRGFEREEDLELAGILDPSVGSWGLDGAEGQEEEPEARALATLGWSQDR